MSCRRQFAQDHLFEELGADLTSFHRIAPHCPQPELQVCPGTSLSPTGKEQPWQHKLNVKAECSAPTEKRKAMHVIPVALPGTIRARSSGSHREECA